MVNDGRLSMKTPFTPSIHAEMIKDGETGHKLRLFPGVLPRDRSVKIYVKSGSRLIQESSKPFQVMYGVLQDMGYLARE